MQACEYEHVVGAGHLELSHLFGIEEAAIAEKHGARHCGAPNVVCGTKRRPAGQHGVDLIQQAAADARKPVSKGRGRAGKARHQRHAA